MIAWVFGVPVMLMVMVLVLDRLEARVVMPAERIGQISSLVERSVPPDVVEREVTVLLAPVVEPPKPVARAS